MPWQYESPNALCPFYRMESRNEVWCEGWRDDIGIRISFVNPEMRNIINTGSAMKYKTEFCRAAWEQCPVARMLNQIYDAAN